MALQFNRPTKEPAISREIELLQRMSIGIGGTPEREEITQEINRLGRLLERNTRSDTRTQLEACADSLERAGRRMDVLEKRNDANFKESDHPRDKSGKFSTESVAKEFGYKHTGSYQHGEYTHHKYEHPTGGSKIHLSHQGHWDVEDPVHEPGVGHGAKKLREHLSYLHSSPYYGKKL